MTAKQIIDRLSHYRAAGEGKWIARCPAHDDSSPSLSIKELPDGRVLIHCHAGCGTLDVLASIGLDFDALFPDTRENYRGTMPQAPQETVDSIVIEIAEHDRAMGKRLSKADIERYRAAKKRGAKASKIIPEIAYEMGIIK